MASVRRILPARGDSVDTTAIAGKDVLGALDVDARTQRRAEQVELTGTEPLARRSRGADGTVIFDEKEPGAVGFTSAM